MTGEASDQANHDELPTGAVTFLFTDLQGSTVMWEEHPDEMDVALAEHDRRLKAAVEQHGGYVFTTAGDSFAVAFASGSEAVGAALDAQRSLLEPCEGITLRVRMALHTGVAALRDGDYFGSAVNRCARLMSAGHGGQILLSQSTRALAETSLDGETELVDLGEHRLKDLREPERVFELRHAALRSGFPPLKTLEGSWSNLPIQLTAFVGRQTELNDVQDLLRSNRLVTLTGSGGSGKTRLALQAAADSLDDHPAGIRLVELAALTDPQFVADEVAERVGAQPAADTDPISAIAAKIGQLSLLVVLDNCEHVVESVAELAAGLLQGCPQLRILATSQVPLDVAGEVRFRVPSLAVPTESDRANAAESDAVRLFVERATAVQQGFGIDDENVDAVIAICRRLDGIPLALELAAARVRVLSPAQILDRLDERFRILGGSGRGVAPRHQTLRAAMEWSHDLLSTDERAVFRRISTFAGTFGIEADEAVNDEPPIDVFDVLDLQTSLVDKSLVTTAHSSSEVRYLVSESMRSYGAEQLRSAGEEVSTGARHSGYFVERAEQLRMQMLGGDLKRALEGLDADEDNFRAALRFLLDHGDLEWAARIVGALGHLWYSAGSFREGIAWCRELFDRDLMLDDELHARVLHAYGTLVGSWEHPQAGAEILEQEVTLRRRLGDPARLAAALNNLGNLLNDIGRREPAEEFLREAIDHFRAAGESASMAFCSLGYEAIHQADYGEAHSLYTEALEEATAHHHDYGIALATMSLGECALRDDRLAEARQRVGDARDRFVTLGVRPGHAYCDLLAAQINLREGDSAVAARCLQLSLENPDAHWYKSTKFWIVQLVAGMMTDATRSAHLIAAAETNYARIPEEQPVWVQEDLAATRDDVEQRLTERELASVRASAASISADEVIAEARQHLEALAIG